MGNEHLQAVVASIQEANAAGALDTRPDVLTGYSGQALYGTLQRLAKRLLTPHTCYLEVGVYQGLTLLSTAMVAPEHSFFGIDNFAFFDPKGENERLVHARAKQLSLSNAHLINADYEDALESLSSHIGQKKVGVYFIDGPHDYRSQMMCLLLIKPHLADNAVILVDDSNYRHVRQANRDFLVAHPEFKLIYESYTPAHPLNLQGRQKEEALKGWWNGINIIYKDSSNLLASDFPETFRDRSLYEQEHIQQALQYPELLMPLWKIARKLGLIPLLKKRYPLKKDFQGKYPHSNTYSDGLPQNRFNSSIFSAKN